MQDIEEEIKMVSIDDLELDPENPRLPESIRNSKAVDMIEYIADQTSINELMDAIGQNDFFSGEPLIVYKKKNASKYVVVEGNRRLVALKLLSNPNIIKGRKHIKESAKDAKFRPEKVPVIIVKNREAVLTYLGYRHITGVKQWDSLAKARYMHQIFLHNTNSKKSPAERYKHTARIIGSKSNYVKRVLDALAMYEKLEEKNFFGISDIDDQNIPFSLLSTATGYEKINEYLGGDGDPIVNSKPIKIQNLKRVAKVIFEKDAEGKTKLGESRNLSLLNDIISDKKATKQLENDAPLEQAWSISRGVEDQFDKSLNIVLSELSKANSHIANVRISDERKTRIKKISEQVEVLEKISDSIKK